MFGMDAVSYHIRGVVAEIVINNPPVNAINHAVRVGIMDGIRRAHDDPNVQTVLLCAEGGTFPVGADVREFNQPAPRD